MDIIFVFMKILLISFLVSISFVNLQEINVEALKKDTSLIQYKKIANEIMIGIKTEKYKLPTNLSEIKNEIAKNPSRDLMIKLFKEGGMTNAEEYLDKVSQQGSFFLEFMKKHPEITKLDQKTKLELMTKLLTN